VELVVDTLFNHFDPWTILALKKALREKAIKKLPSKHQFIIDSGFALRLLLEFYRSERRNRYKLLRQSFYGSGTGGKITFKTFRKVMEMNYPEASDAEVAFLFRESHAFGNVRPKVFYRLV
jgi:hypothetical protein